MQDSNLQMAARKLPFEMSDEFPLIPEHLGPETFRAQAAIRLGYAFQLDWLRGCQKMRTDLCPQIRVSRGAHAFPEVGGPHHDYKRRAA
jgi:hypothetical protein